MSKEREQFINKYKLDVINATKNTNLFPSVKMAQFIIESADNKGRAGEGVVFKKALNGFGIKADKNYKGAKMLFSTPKDATKLNYFRVYNSVYDSIKDHSNFLLNNSRYQKAGVFTAKTPEEQIQRIAKAGYSESPTYAKAIISLINAYNLKSLDNTTQSNKSDNTALILLLLVGLGVYYLDK